MKLLIKKIFILTMKIIAPFFYNKNYLCGRYFDDSIEGWTWVFRGIWYQKILGFNRRIPWVTCTSITISSIKNIIFHPNSINNFQSPGCYFQNFKGKIYIGDNVYIAPNVGLITTNHNLNNLSTYDKAKNIVIGKNCWIGMNSVLLPGVKLGENTIVGAGSIVTKSFRQGKVVIAGNPARVINNL
jgi:acetyltransferase-like isoleucine patch superfamily enzyme